MSREEGDPRLAFLDRLIDDAGLFPPARLAMEPAVAAHMAHRSGPHGWIQGRFLCPASRLVELTDALPVDAPDWPVGVIADGVTTLGNESLAAHETGAAQRAWADAVSDDLQQAASLAVPLRAEALEARLPDGVEPGGAISALLARAPTTSPRVQPALELPLGGSGEPSPSAVVAAIGQARRELGAGDALDPPVAKLRCGGAVVPSTELVAEVVAACVAHRVPLKATAGLHHPLYGREHTDGVPHHGFLNLFGGLMLHATGEVAPDELAEVLAETDPAALRLTADGLVWQDHLVGPAEVAASRRDGLVVGFGSCDFDEPVGELAELGAVPQTQSRIAG
jgi:hypothetical protein